MSDKNLAEEFNRLLVEPKNTFEAYFLEFAPCTSIANTDSEFSCHMIRIDASGKDRTEAIANMVYRMRSDSNVNKACIIRNTMQDIEDYARFRFLKYISCYNEVLVQAFKMRNQIDLIGMIPNLNLQLEFGVSKQTQVSLMGLGLSRNTVILLDEYISNENLSPAECIKWLRNAALDSYNLNEINIKEIKKMLDQHTD